MDTDSLHITVVTGDKDKAKCNYCDGLLSRRSGRIKTHLEKCRKFKLAEKELNEDDDLDRQALSTSAEPPKKKRLDSYVTRTSPNQKKQLDLKDARFFFLFKSLKEWK